MKKQFILIITAAILLASCAGGSNSDGFSSQRFFQGFTMQLFSGLSTFIEAPTGAKSGAEATVENFVLSLANGNCENAMKNATGRALQAVQAIMDSGCSSYKTEIKSITCDGQKESARCSCVEARDGYDMNFIYEMQFIDKKWKVENYEKDLSTD